MPSSRWATSVTELEELGQNLKDDDFLGKGTLTVSEIFYTSPSRCAVADSCVISVDRRLTAGEGQRPGPFPRSRNCPRPRRLKPRSPCTPTTPRPLHRAGLSHRMLFPGLDRARGA